MTRRKLLLGACWCVAGLLGLRAEQPSRIVVLSYNIRHGLGTDGKIDLERTAAVIRSVSPDVVALQEVDRGTERSGGVDQARELGRLTGLQAVFGRAIDYQGGQYGNAVLSRLPIRGSRVHPLPGQEPRALLEVELGSHSGGSDPAFLLFATHLDATRPETHRIEAARRILAATISRPLTPALLAGDLNTVPERETMKILLEAWRVSGGEIERPTVPVETPKRQIDYVLFRPEDRWKTVEVRVLDEKTASDHRPILAVLELLPPSR